jgi:hypothetical protein
MSRPGGAQASTGRPSTVLARAERSSMPTAKLTPTTLASLDPDSLANIASCIIADGSPSAERSLMSAILSCKALAHACDSSLFSFRTKVETTLRSSQTYVCRYALVNTSIAGGGSASLIGNHGNQPILRLVGRVHLRGIVLSSRVEVEHGAVATIVGCKFEAGLDVFAGATVQLIGCHVANGHGGPHGGTLCYLRGLSSGQVSESSEGQGGLEQSTLHATDCTFTSHFAAHHISAESCRAVDIDGCTFRGAVVGACIHVRPAAATASLASPRLMESLVVRASVFCAPHLAPGADAWVAVHVRGGALPPGEGTRLIGNVWNGRGLVIEAKQRVAARGALPPAVIAPAAVAAIGGDAVSVGVAAVGDEEGTDAAGGRARPRSPSFVSAKVLCEGNDFGAGGLMASGEEVLVRLLGASATAHPGSVVARGGATVHAHDESGALLWNLTIFLGAYRLIPAIPSGAAAQTTSTPCALRLR